MSDHTTPTVATESHDHGHSPEDIARHVKGYLLVGVALLLGALCGARGIRFRGLPLRVLALMAALRA